MVIEPGVLFLKDNTRQVSSQISQREGEDRVPETEGRVLLRDVAHGTVALAASLLSFGYRIRVEERALRVEQAPKQISRTTRDATTLN